MTESVQPKPELTPAGQESQAPWPGSHHMPRWTVGELPKPPQFSWIHLTAIIGPGLVMGAAAIGGGEWLTGPAVTARYGGTLLWLATISILGQALYNIEISRYTLYTGEPIFTGKFRIMPHPLFWTVIYLLLDFGSFLPYLASNAAIPGVAMILGRLPDPKITQDYILLQVFGSAIFILVFLPLIFGGKVYRSLKILMTFKLVVVVGFLLFLAVGYSTWDTWREIFTGFFRFGTLPLAGEPGAPVETANVLHLLFTGQRIPAIDMTMIGFVAAMAAIAGNGGLTNTPISNYTRDQGWGMGRHVGAIPSIIGGQEIKLSHVGKIFLITKESLLRWRGWLRHVQNEQIFLWIPACFLGMALPSMLSIQFLPRGTILEDKWLAAGMTADGVAQAVGGSWGPFFWNLTLFCGFLVLFTSMASTVDGVLRRWVDVFWTASPMLRKWKPESIGKFYFLSLCVYGVIGLIMLNLLKGDMLMIWSTNLYNYALGFSCWHILFVNTVLLPREIRPGWARLIGLFLIGCFFILIAVLTTYNTLCPPPAL